MRGFATDKKQCLRTVSRDENGRRHIVSMWRNDSRAEHTNT